MARLIPIINPSEIVNSGERKIAEALVSQLPARVDVFHSFRWLRTEKDHLVEGECDFVILDPNEGMLFIEVKGGSLTFDPKSMTWVRNLPNGGRETLRKSPFDQASGSMYALLEKIRNEQPYIGCKELPFTYGYAVAFPDSKPSGSLPPNTTADLVLDAEKCRDMAESIEQVFRRWHQRTHPPMTGPQKDGVYEALFPRFGILPVLWRKVEDQEERLRRLTREQEHLLEFMADQPLAAIKGVAGSGKTILALAKAQTLARQKIKTLFLCYNKPLKDWLKQAIPESEYLVIETYHGIAAEMCRLAGIAFAPQKKGEPLGQAFWDTTAPELLEQALDQLGPEHKFNAMVVDEGQDFRDLWWTTLDSLFCDPAKKQSYYVFYDPKQNLFVENPSLPGELGKPFLLPVNCRNTVKIAEHCSELIGESAKTRDGAPIGDQPSLVAAESLDDAFQKAGKVIRQWCMPNGGGLKLSQVAVLAPGSTKDHWPDDFKTIPLSQNFNTWRAGKTVLLETWARFKGLEADAIVIIEAEGDELSKDSANRYVARSRAKHLLTIIQVKKA